MSAAPPLLLITSAAYVNAEIAAEFGHLPPCFLPFGHARLYAAQLAGLPADGARRVLTLPASFTPSDWDRRWLEEKSVELLPVPDDLSLGESVLYALTLCDARGALRILHGDTLFLEPPGTAADGIGVATTSDAYAWGAVSRGAGRAFNRRLVAEEQGEQVLTGWFSLADAPGFVRALTRARGDFLAALDLYAAEHPLQLQEMRGWLDFGHLQTFYRARSQVSTTRAFNALTVSGHTVLKTGDKADKLAAEAAWFEALPPPLRLHTPPFLGREGEGYRIGYEFSPTLHELFVFGRLEPAAWRPIMAGCFDFLAACARFRPAPPLATAPDALRALALDKTQARLESWARSGGPDLDEPWRYDGLPLPSLRRIAEETARVAAASDPLPGVMHGDFCFPNTFFDFRQRLVKVIDPRGGLREGEHTVQGDLRYDLAKLKHSVEGYDLILAGRHRLERHGARDVALHLPRDGAAGFLPGIAAEFTLQGQRISDPGITALTIHLFLSMLPLHADRPDRQRAFLANALRLYAQMEARQ
ncbi:MAG TPA: capsular biosynthesis protein [Roseomonas sp.]|nr:capsular biosynthesis protein [Roseomonas sp.]